MRKKERGNTGREIELAVNCRISRERDGRIEKGKGRDRERREGERHEWEEN